MLKTHILVLLFLIIHAVHSDICLGFLGYDLRTQYGDPESTYAIYDLQLMNTGSCAIIGGIIFVGNPYLTLSQYWNLQSSSDAYYLTFTNLGVVEFSYSGAGLIVNYNSSITNGDPQLSIHYLSCSSCGINSDPHSPSIDVSVFNQLADLNSPLSASITVPSPYKLIGGGFSFDTTNVTGYQISQSYPLNSTTWHVEEKGHIVDESPQRVRVYAIALYDPLDEFLVDIFESDFVEAGQASGSYALILDSNFALGGGGALSDQFLVASYPYQEFGIASWRASFIADPLIQGDVSSTGLKVFVIGIKVKNTSYVVNSLPIATVPITPLSSQITFSSQSTSPPGYLKTVNGGFIATNALVQSSYPLSPIVNSGLSLWFVEAINVFLPSPSLVVYALGVGAFSSNYSSPDNIHTINAACSASLVQNIVSSWPGSVQYSVTITNNGTKDITNIGFYPNNANAITSIWTVHETTYSLHDFVYTLYTPPNYVGVIHVGSSFQFGFIATQEAIDFDIVNISCN